MAESKENKFETAICQIARLLSIEPLYNSNKRRLQKWYAIVLVTAFISGYIASLHGKVKNVYPKQIYTVAVIDALSYTVLTLSVVTAIIRSSFCDVQKFKDYLQIMFEINNTMEKEKIAEVSNRRFCIETSVGHMVMILILVYDGYIWVKIVGKEIYAMYILKDVAQYVNFIIVLLIYNYIILIKVCFQNANNFLSSIGGYYKNCDSSHSEIKVDNYICSEKPDISEKVKTIRKLYSQLIALVGISNVIFGWKIFFVCGIILMGILEAVNFSLVVTVSENRRLMDNIDLELDFFALIISWCLVLSIMGVVVAVTCDMTTKEAQRTATVCYNLLLDVPAVSNNVQDKILKEELMLLAQQATHQCPYFSAAGFFNVDYTMLFGLLGTVTSYIIVLIQINK